MHFLIFKVDIFSYHAHFCGLCKTKDSELSIVSYHFCLSFPISLTFIKKKNITLSERCYKVFICIHTVQDRYRRFCYVNAYFLLTLTDFAF
jgi:hypothetical protein